MTVCDGFSGIRKKYTVWKGSMMSFLEVIKQKKNEIIVLSIVAVIVLATVFISATVSASAMSSKTWEVKAGKRVMAVFKSEEEANKVVDGVKNHYVEKGDKLISVNVTPQITVAEHNQDDKSKSDVKLAKNAKSVVDQIVKGDVVTKSYKVKDGDTMWDIAQDLKLSVFDLRDRNKNLDWENILPGDEVKYDIVKPIVEVVTEKETESEKVVPYDTDVKYDDSMYEGESEVKTEGKYGKRKVKEHIVSKNGVVVKSKELSSETLEKPVNKVVVEGTKEKEEVVSSSGASSSSSKSYSAPSGGTGSSIASYACQFVGNPYVLGGSSLTNGADCAGFIYRVFTNCGVSVPYIGPEIWLSYGTGVSYSEARPGDVIVYPGHVSMYIGGGKEVHAIGTQWGIDVTDVGFAGQYLSIRRVL